MDPNSKMKSRAIPGLRGRSIVYIDDRGYVYYKHSIRRDIRYLRCKNRRNGCPVSAKMATIVGAAIEISQTHVHNHEPTPRYSVELRGFMNNKLRETDTVEYIAPQYIVDQEAHVFRHPGAAMEVSRPAVVRRIARVRHRNSPPVPESLRGWVDILHSDQWGPRLRNVNGQLIPFYQGPLEILRNDGSIHFAGIVFTNTTFIHEMSAHFNTIRTMCMDGTFQIRPRQPADIEQLFTIQVILNNMAIPIVYALLVDRQTETYCRVLQFVRNDLKLNVNFEHLQVITDFDQSLQNAIESVLPEANNSGSWFHYIQRIIEYVRTHGLVNLFRVNENARHILRMLMALAHLPAIEEKYNGISYSILMGFRLIQDLVIEYNLGVELQMLMRYYERFWMDIVTPRRFTVFGLWYRTNNYIESFHASLLRLMGQHPTLYGFYDNLRTVEEGSRNFFSRVVNGQKVKQADYSVYPRNDTKIRNAWINVENGTYNLSDFLINVSYTSEQILRNEIGEPNFQHQAIVPVINMQPLVPLSVPHLTLAPARPPPPIYQPIVLQPPTVLTTGPHLSVQPLRPLAPVQQPQTRPPLDVKDVLVLHPHIRGPRHTRGRGRRIDEVDHLHPVENRGRRQGRKLRRGQGQLHADNRPHFQTVAETSAKSYEDLDNCNEREQVSPPDQQPYYDLQNTDVLEVCILCFERVVVVKLIPCGHQFCNQCVTKFMEVNHNVCPLCRDVK